MKAAGARLIETPGIVVVVVDDDVALNNAQLRSNTMIDGFAVVQQQPGSSLPSYSSPATKQERVFDDRLDDQAF